MTPTKEWIQIVSLLAIPVVLGIGSWANAYYLQRATLSRDYVQLAVGILRESNDQENAVLREWATDLIDEYSDVELPPELAQQLEAGTMWLPPGLTTRSWLTELQDADRLRRASLAGVTLPRGQLDNLVPLLVLLLSHEDEKVRSLSASILKDIDTPEAMEALREYEK